MDKSVELTWELNQAGYRYVSGTPKPQPISKPQFSLSELRAAVPAHCFERKIVKSFGYLALNFLICGLLLVGAYIGLEQMESYSAVKAFGYVVYWFVQGSYMTGIWVIGHECGHNAFTVNHVIDDIVGIICHSVVLVPYHSFQITHRRHHSNTNSCEHDQGFVPSTRKDLKPTWSETLEDSPIYNLYKIVEMLVFGWMPSYLCFNITGPKKFRGGPKSHFNPSAALFLPKERLRVVMGDIAVASTILILFYLSSIYGFSLIFRLYLLPYSVTNAYLVIIFYLQHTDTYIPHFREDEWTWLRGSLCTVDRNFGKWLNTVLHHLVDTHVCHHIFPQMPFYNAIEATEAIKPILGDYYLRDNTPVLSAMWRSFTNCKFVEDDGTVVFYQKHM